jgi:hypothetical protein
LSEARGFATTVLRDVSDREAEQRIKDALALGPAVGGALVVVWAGDGKPSAEGLATSSASV